MNNIDDAERFSLFVSSIEEYMKEGEWSLVKEIYRDTTFLEQDAEDCLGVIAELAIKFNNTDILFDILDNYNDDEYVRSHDLLLEAVYDDNYTIATILVEKYGADPFFDFTGEDGRDNEEKNIMRIASRQGWGDIFLKYADKAPSDRKDEIKELMSELCERVGIIPDLGEKLVYQKFKPVLKRRA
jgi:hypothetical protein